MTSVEWTSHESRTGAVHTKQGAAMRVRRAVVLSIPLILVSMLMTASPVAGQSSGTVGASVSVPSDGSCLTIDAWEVWFGELPFSQPGAPSMGSSTPMYTVSNCGTLDISVLIRGSDAMGTSAWWTMTDDVMLWESCPPDAFVTDFDSALGTGDFLSPYYDKSFGMLEAGVGALVNHNLGMPCQGSSGSGQIMWFNIFYTATAA